MKRNAGRAVYRLVTAAVLTKVDPTLGGVRAAAATLYADDPVTLHVAKAAVTPATTTATGWAAELAATAVAEFVASLAPQSAAAQLMALGEKASLDGRYTIAYPRRLGLPSTVPFVAEGGPIPVAQRDLSAVLLGPTRKMAIISAFSEELAQRSAVEAVVTTILKEDAAASLDAALFSNAAASSSRPAGLLNGVTPLSASAYGGVDATKTVADLVAAIVAAGGGAQLVFFASPARAVTLAMVGAGAFPHPIVATRAIAADALVAIDPGSFVSGFGPEPRVDTTGEAVLHFDDTTPLAIGTAGTPAAVAAASRSLFQSDLVGVRLMLDVAWTMRAPHVAIVTGLGW